MLGSMDPTDDELEHLLETLRVQMTGTLADEFADANENIMRDEAAGEIDRRRRLESSVLCALILLHRSRN